MNENERCPRLETISGAIDHALSPEAAAGFASHVSACPVCEVALDRMSQARAALRAMQAEAPGFDLSPAVLNRLPPPRRRRRAAWSWGLLPSATTAVGVLAIGAVAGALLSGGLLPEAGGRAPMLAAFDVAPPGMLCMLDGCRGGAR
jgi:anti-sigma factor RsiW